MLIPARSGPAAARREVLATLPAPELILLAAVIVVGAALRLATLRAQSYWLDEAYTVHYLHSSLGGLLHQVRVSDASPPLYFVLAWLWAKLFGTGEAGLRSLSAMAGIGLLPLVYLCARELLSRWAAVLAAALAAVNPFLIWYSQEARAYALLAMLCTASLLFCLRARAAPTRTHIALWAACSSLAILTHFFAAFLIAPEALLLLWRGRSRELLLACGTLAAVQVAMLPLALGDTTHGVGWIQALSLSTRLQQIPIQFGFGSLYQSSIVGVGLVGAAVLAAVVVALLVFGGGERERRGAALAGALAGAVILVPILPALLGRDYVVPRNLIPGWAPLAIVLAAACTAPRARVGGGLLAVALLAGFLWAGVRIAGSPQYQRPDWRAVAAALGSPTGPRGIVAYDGAFATPPLSIYLGGASWGAQGPGSVTVSELDVVGSAWQTPAGTLPVGVTLLSTRTVNGFLVARFLIAGGWRLSPLEMGQHAAALLPPAPAAPAVLIQRSAGHPLA